jgi:type IV pilus assembly protein PilA
MKQKGFTLIELLVVVAIIGILAAVGVVAYSGYTSGAKIKATQQNLKTISKWLSAESTKVCSAKQGRYKNGMYLNNDDSNNAYFMKCSDDVTALAYAASQYFYNNNKFKNPYNGNNAIASKAVKSSYTITMNGTKTLSNTYVQKGEIMFFDLGGENKTAILSNVGDSNGSDKNEWVFIDSPRNY